MDDKWPANCWHHHCQQRHICFYHRLRKMVNFGLLVSWWIAKDVKLGNMVFMLWPSLCRDRLFEQVVSYLNLNYVLHFTPFIKFLSPWKGWCNISNKVLFRDNLFIWVHWNLICLDPVPLIFVCLHSLSSWSQ